MPLRKSRILADRSNKLLNDVGPQKETDVIRMCYVGETGDMRLCK